MGDFLETTWDEQELLSDTTTANIDEGHPEVSRLPETDKFASSS